MKTVAITLLAAALAFAQSGTSSANTSRANTSPKGAAKAAPTASSRKSAAAAQPAPKGKPEPAATSIPAGATLVEPNLYRYTDSTGKTWNYRQTPFGISKWEETASTPQATPAPAPKPLKAEPVAVTDLGDSYRFEKKTPFGNSTWVHNKSELTDEEKAAVAANTKPAGNQ